MQQLSLFNLANFSISTPPQQENHVIKPVEPPQELNSSQEDRQAIDKAVNIIKCMSVHAPHAYAICMDKKHHELRNSSTKRRGWILIHSSSSKASDSWFPEYGIDPSIVKIERGAIIGAAFIDGCIHMEKDDYYAYEISRYKKFTFPLLGVKGCQSIFWGHSNDPLKIKAFRGAINQMLG